MRSKLFVGVDPGKEGAIAVINGDADRPAETRIIELKPIPMLLGESKKGKKPRPEYDIRAIAVYFKTLRGLVRLVTVERSQPLPMMPDRMVPRGKNNTFKPGSIAQFNRGVQRGFEWLLKALDIECELVPPRTWMRVMHEGQSDDDTKARSINAALQLFPGADLRRTPKCRTPHDGNAEALLLAEYGRRTHGG